MSYRNNRTNGVISAHALFIIATVREFNNRPMKLQAHNGAGTGLRHTLFADSGTTREVLPLS